MCFGNQIMMVNIFNNGGPLIFMNKCTFTNKPDTPVLHG